VTYACQVRDIQVSGGPGWADSEAYNIQATAGGSSADMHAMMQTLLGSRFSLKLHRDSKEMSVYDLVLGKKGPLMQDAGKPGFGVGPGRGRIAGRGADMRTLASVLAGPLGRIVRDRTGLAGYFNFTITYRPDDAPADDPHPSLLTAIQEQLGLRLDPARAPVEVLMIDSVSRPTAN